MKCLTCTVRYRTYRSHHTLHTTIILSSFRFYFPISMMYVYFFGIAFVQRIQNRNESNGEGKMFYNIRRKKQWPECGTHIHSLLFRVSCCCCWLFFFYYSVYWNFQWTVSLASIFLFGLLFAGTFNAVLSNANVESKCISILYAFLLTAMRIDNLIS